ncbi:hypothetical protein LOD99_4140 [Oopsacas minuta]|uniref:Uncharacterized protein n=1 Tax=Oopsacas minuta TaxID=111878 RepID=A0AAV7JUY3_9METZ|nr:hypothetical protein LOD99_4140 [Oopsacas minuta]
MNNLYTSPPPIAVSEELYENAETILRNSSQPNYSFVSNSDTLIHPVACSPPQSAQKSYELADLYDELQRYKRDNEALRKNLDFTYNKHEEIVRRLQTKIFDLEKEREIIPVTRPPATRSESVCYDRMPNMHANLSELSKYRDEAMNLQAVVVAYQEDVKNINEQLNECQRAKNVLSREAQERNEKIVGLENEIASLTFLLKDYSSARNVNL